MKNALAILALLPTPLWAQDWTQLSDDAAITAALSDRVIIFDAYTRQTFGAAGDTQFVTERLSNGRWAARGGQYCSTWPPSDIWDCYDFQVNGDRVRFISSDRSVSEGEFRK